MRRCSDVKVTHQCVLEGVSHPHFDLFPENECLYMFDTMEEIQSKIEFSWLYCEADHFFRSRVCLLLTK